MESATSSDNNIYTAFIKNWAKLCCPTNKAKLFIFIFILIAISGPQGGNTCPDHCFAVKKETE